MAGTISSPDVHKIQRHNAGDMKDMISDLPVVILHYILSLLSTKEAIRTSILSPKWRYLWTQLPVFDFEIPPPLNDSNSKSQTSANCLLDLVGRLLHRSNFIERLCVKIHKSTFDAHKIRSLTSSAGMHKVQDLQLSLGDVSTKYVLPHSFSDFKSLNKLWLGLKFTLDIPSRICFPSLKTLVVSDVTFANEKSVQSLFSGCPILQELALYNFHFKNIKQINLAISTLRMLSIHFHPVCLHYDHFDKCIFKINAGNLLSLRCKSKPTIEFIPVNLSSIVEACVDLDYNSAQGVAYASDCAIKLLSGLNSVQSLKISSKTFECIFLAKDFLHRLPSLPNLTHLYALSGYSYGACEILIDILHKTPKLEALDIISSVFACVDKEWTLISVPYCVKYSLKLLHISSFSGYKYEIQFVVFFLENAISLAEIQIVCSRHLSADFERLANVRNQLQHVGLGSCVIKFSYESDSPLQKISYNSISFDSDSSDDDDDYL